MQTLKKNKQKKRNYSLYWQFFMLFNHLLNKYILLNMSNLAIFVSGSGSNAENIYKYFNNNDEINVKLFCSNNAKAYAIERSKKLGIDCFIFNREEYKDEKIILEKLSAYNIDFIILAGYLWLIPTWLIKSFTDKIINIHPALLPKYGGKGMYGMNVHNAVIDNKETESGITIHLVNENYDEGKIIYQAKCRIEPGDNAELLAQKVHKLEYEYFPKVIEKYITGFIEGKL